MKTDLSRVKMFEKFYLIAAILYIIRLPGIDAAVKVQSQKIYLSENELAFSYESYNDGKLTYATCAKNGENGERKCKIVRETTPYSHGEYFCDITIKLDHRQGKEAADNDRLSVIPFGKNKVIFYQAEKGRDANVKINTVNLDDCKVTGNEITITNPMKNPAYAVIVTPYEDSYDIIYKNFDMCGTKGRCKMTIDAAGKITDGPRNTTQTPAFLRNYPNVAAIDPKSRDKGTFYMEPVKGSLMEYDFTIHKPDGSKKSLGKHKAHMPMVKSVSNNLLSMCYKENVIKSNCIQYDNDGNTKFEIDPVSNYNRTDLAAVYNLPSGGLLALAGMCDKRYCEPDQLQFLVIKIDPTGKIVGTLNTGTLKFGSGPKDIKLIATSFHTDKDNNYCLSMANHRNAETDAKLHGIVETRTHCFTDQDFSG